MAFWKRYRPALLGIFATIALAWMTVEQFGVPWQQMADFLLGAVLALIVIVGAAFLVAMLIRFFR